MSLAWYAVYTRPRWEKKVAESLSRNGVENYCPLNKVERQWSDRKKIILEPLFTSYVFVRVDTKQQQGVVQLDGVLNFVYWLGKPAIIRDEEIDAIKGFLLEHSNVTLTKARININDRVRILNGPFTDLEGDVLAVNNRTVRIILPSLGFVMTADLEKNGLRVVTH